MNERSKQRLKRRLLEASKEVLREQSDPVYESDARRIMEEIGARSAAYLGKLEADQALSVSRLSGELYKG